MAFVSEPSGREFGLGAPLAVVAVVVVEDMAARLVLLLVVWERRGGGGVGRMTVVEDERWIMGDARGGCGTTGDTAALWWRIRLLAGWERGDFGDGIEEADTKVSSDDVVVAVNGREV
jgi:hypothetical protein